MLNEGYNWGGQVFDEKMNVYGSIFVFVRVHMYICISCKLRNMYISIPIKKNRNNERKVSSGREKEMTSPVPRLP